MNELRPVADLHCHILPDWDDGPRNWDDSLALARAAAESGIRQILVTPHVGRKLRGIEEKPAESIGPSARALEEKLRAEGLDLTLIPAAELTMDSEDLSSRLKAEPYLTIGGQGYYALIESTFNRWPAYAERLLQDVFYAGVTPIIAHPERYSEVQHNPMVLRAAFEKGALMQITARSFLGEDDRRVKACAMALLKANMVTIVASDAHNARAAFPEAVVNIIVKTVGESDAQRILIDNPRKILAGDPVYNPDIRAGRSAGGILGKLLGR